MSSELNGSTQVLVVEDSPDLRELLCLQLGFGGYRAVCADDGAQALSMLDEVRPDIVLTDVHMPAVSGTDLTRHLRSTPKYARVPVVLYTGINADDRDLVAAMSLPLVRCVSKGAPMKALLAVMAELTAPAPA